MAALCCCADSAESLRPLRLPLKRWCECTTRPLDTVKSCRAKHMAPSPQLWGAVSIPAGINPKVKSELLNPAFDSESLLHFSLFHSVPSFLHKNHTVQNHNDYDCDSVVFNISIGWVKYVQKESTVWLHKIFYSQFPLVIVQPKTMITGQVTVICVFFCVCWVFCLFVRESLNEVTFLF